MEYADYNGPHPCTTPSLPGTDWIQEFIDARPSAELLPLSAGEQDDESEAEMGLTYDELSTFGVLRKVLLPWNPPHQDVRSDLVTGGKAGPVVLLPATAGRVAGSAWIRPSASCHQGPALLPLLVSHFVPCNVESGA